MQAIALLVAGLFSWFYIDLNHQRFSTRRENQLDELSVEIGKRKEKRKRQRKQYKNRKYKKRKFFKEKHYKFKSTKSMDHRYSDQRKIRRMHYNC